MVRVGQCRSRVRCAGANAKDWVTGIPTPTSGLVCLAYEIQDSSLDPNFVVTPNEILVDRLGNKAPVAAEFIAYFGAAHTSLDRVLSPALLLAVTT